MTFLIAAAAGAYFAQSSLLDRMPKEHKEDLLVAKDKATIMIMGVDERSDDVGRSDTLMVATIDPVRKETSLLSIPRDTRVAIPKNGYDKINAAYAYGGERLTQATVEDFLGVRIDHYVIINTHAFQKIVDAIGGIDIDVEKRMYYEDPWDDDGGLIIDLRPGMQHMDGKTAVTYVRYRDEEGDIGRVRRQQKFMRACVDAVTTPAILPRLPGIISSVIDSVKTDLSVRQMLEFVGALKESQARGLRTEMVPGRPLYIDEVSYWIPDMAQLRRGMANALGITLSNTERSRMERDVRAYEESIPAGATEVPAGKNGIGRAVSADEADQWMARATATLASLRPGGYDYAYPTKILASLAQGTPVIYAGPGQAARDVREGGLGVACALDSSQVAEAMVVFASDSVHWVGAEQARAWVRENRSVDASSRAAAAAVRSAV